MSNEGKSSPNHFFREVFGHLIAMVLFTPLAWLATYLWRQNWQMVATISVIAMVLATVTYGTTMYFSRKARREALLEARADFEAEIRHLKDQLTQLHSSDTSLSLEGFAARTEEHHQFVHKARDLVVKMMEAMPINRQINNPIVVERFHDDLKVLLKRMANLFRMIVPKGTKVFASIRERRKDDFITIARAGDCDDAKRQAGTRPLHKRMRMIEELEESFRTAQDCVLLTGSAASNWQKQPNDGYKEDLAVLMGAVFPKKWLSSRADYKFERLTWIICVAASEKDAFSEKHKPLMKCFNDIFALLLNTFLRLPCEGPSDRRAHNQEVKIPVPSSDTHEPREDGKTWP